MSEKYIKKSIKLSLELDRYLSKNSRILNNIPRGSSIIITKDGDKDFTRYSRSITKRSNEKFIEARKIGSKWQLKSLGVI